MINNNITNIHLDSKFTVPQTFKLNSKFDPTSRLLKSTNSEEPIIKPEKPVRMSMPANRVNFFDQPKNYNSSLFVNNIGN